MAAPVIIIMGPPGAGKGTQSALLAQRLGGVHLSSGQILRKSHDTEIEATMAAGELVDSVAVERVLVGVLTGVPQEQAMVLDGFVREPSDIGWVERCLGELGRPISAVINIDVERDEAIGRNIKRGRSDDRPDVQAHRWQLYERERPVLEHYQAEGLLHEVNGVGSIEAVAERIEAVLA